MSDFWSGRKRKPLSEETKEKIRETQKGKIIPDEMRKRISETLKKKYEENPSLREKISKTLVGKIMNSNNPQNYIRTKKGVFFSEKNGCELHYDSSYELTAYNLLEQMSIVEKYERCPYVVPYVFSDGVKHRYIPDILIKYVNGIEEVVEVKPKSRLKEEKNKYKIKSAMKFFQSKGIKFNVWTEEDLGI